MFSGGTLFVDHAPQCIDLHYQATIGTTYTVRSKELHDIYAVEHDIKVKTYHSDNGVYTSKGFKEDIHKNN